MSRMSMLAKGVMWELPLLAAYCLGQTPAARPGMNGMRPMVRRNFAPAPKTVVAAPVLPAAPQAPPTLSQLPATPPQVGYQDGMLTIVAQNSTLGDILREVHRTTGASVDVPPNATERVVGRMGPGPAPDVLASLLNGSSFNYVLLGSAADPTRLASVTLTMKSGGAPAETAANVYQPPPQQYGPIPPGTGPGGPVVQPAPGDDEADAEEEKDDEDTTAEEDQAQDQGQGQGQAPGVSNFAPSPDAPQTKEMPKTPEEILEMLRQRRGQIPPGQPMPPQNQQQNQNNDDNN